MDYIPVAIMPFAIADNKLFSALQPNDRYKYDPHLCKSTQEAVLDWFQNASTSQSQINRHIPIFGHRIDLYAITLEGKSPVF